MKVRGVIVMILALASACASSGPPTMPLTPGAETVEVRDADTIKTKPIDVSKCVGIGQIHVGPVAQNNIDVAIKNETFARGGNFFFGTSYGGNLAMADVTGMAYRCGGR